MSAGRGGGKSLQLLLPIEGGREAGRAAQGVTSRGKLTTRRRQDPRTSETTGRRGRTDAAGEGTV